jgi:putative endonuclease
MSKINKNNREKGNIGEDIACDFLIKNGYLIQDRNYLKKWGEIDIIAIKQGILNFIEVKSVIDKGRSNGHRPEENVHELKLRKLRRVIQIYLNEKKYGIDAEFKFHIITVTISEITGKSAINFLENIIL